MADVLETNGIEERKAQALARYLVEPKDQPQVSIQEDTAAAQSEIVGQLRELVGPYSVFNDANQAKRLTEQLTRRLAKCKETLRDALQLEDYNDEGVVPVQAFDEAFTNLDIELDAEEKEYLLCTVY